MLENKNTVYTWNLKATFLLKDNKYLIIDYNITNRKIAIKSLFILYELKSKNKRIHNITDSEKCIGKNLTKFLLDRSLNLSNKDFIKYLKSIFPYRVVLSNEPQINFSEIEKFKIKNNMFGYIYINKTRKKMIDTPLFIGDIK